MPLHVFPHDAAINKSTSVPCPWDGHIPPPLPAIMSLPLLWISCSFLLPWYAHTHTHTHTHIHPHPHVQPTRSLLEVILPPRSRHLLITECMGLFPPPSLTKCVCVGVCVCVCRKKQVIKRVKSEVEIADWIAWQDCRMIYVFIYTWRLLHISWSGFTHIYIYIF